MRHSSTTFAKLVVYLIGLAALSVCIILLPELAREEMVAKPGYNFQIYPFLVGAYLLFIPFFTAVFQSLKFLNLIDENKAFSKLSLNTLKNIKICAVVISLLILLTVITGISFIKFIDPSEDVTHIITLGFVLTSISGVLVVFVALLEKVLLDAFILKSENDSIV